MLHHYQDTMGDFIGQGGDAPPLSKEITLEPENPYSTIDRAILLAHKNDLQDFSKCFAPSISETHISTYFYFIKNNILEVEWYHGIFDTDDDLFCFHVSGQPDFRLFIVLEIHNDNWLILDILKGTAFDQESIL